MENTIHVYEVMLHGSRGIISPVQASRHAASKGRILPATLRQIGLRDVAEATGQLRTRGEERRVALLCLDYSSTSAENPDAVIAPDSRYHMLTGISMRFQDWCVSESPTVSVTR